jgi:hypothetical protein
MFSGSGSPNFQERLAANRGVLPFDFPDEKAGLKIIAELASQPKAFVPFHRYANGMVRTAFDEHVAEWRNATDGVTLHFTVSPEHVAFFKERLADVPRGSCSTQFPSTDLLAWDLDKEGPLRDEKGCLVFRPGGHGALLKNLAQTSADVVIVRNIDNVVRAERQGDRRLWDGALAGRALALEEERNELVNALKVGNHQAVSAARSWLLPFVKAADRLAGHSAEQLLEQLSRPIRVAGVVKNEGAPGGGPFWVRTADGSVRPAIAEAAELTAGLLDTAAYFNPVQLACIMPQGDQAESELKRWADASAFFVSQKDFNGRPILALEHPGLWNGCMSNWLTQFVEVPFWTFQPAKTLWDLIDRQ